jgi:biopolymer transport protein ExbD
MAGGAATGDDEAISQINITPFVDVLLVLLVIFMVTANMIVNKGMKVELPEVSTSEQLPKVTAFNISVSKDGVIYFDKEIVTIEALKARGKAAKDSGDKIQVTLSADKGAIYDNVVQVMDALRSVGIVDFGLQLEPKQGPPR